MSIPNLVRSTAASTQPCTLITKEQYVWLSLVTRRSPADSVPQSNEAVHAREGRIMSVVACVHTVELGLHLFV